MEKIIESESDDVDRESLVKEIELIRRTLGGVSNTENSDLRSDYAVDEDDVVERDSEDSEDELAILKSPGYTEESEEDVRQNQDIPVVVIPGDDENEQTAGENKGKTTSHAETGKNENREFSQDISEGVSYEISAILPRDNPEEVELILTPVTSGAESMRTSQPVDTIDVSSSSNYIESDTSCTLTELQPAVNDNSFTAETPSVDNCWSSFNQSLQLSQYSFSTRQQYSPEEAERMDETIPEEDDVHYEGEQGEVYRCLRLNRKYQAIIEEELRRTERSLMENREMQLGLTQMTQSSLTKAEAVAFKQLASFSNPYFRDKRRESPPDNEDTKIRKSNGQPSPFQKPAKQWSKAETKTLADAVKSEVLQAKLTPLLRRIEILDHRISKTEEEKTEIKELKMEVQRTKSLPLVSLVQNHTLPIDWEDITHKMLRSRTPLQCKVYWYNEIHPLLNQDKWTAEEDKKLVKLATKNNAEDWTGIARELKTNRSAVQCFRRYQTALNKGFLKSKWDEEEDKRLIEAVKICGTGAWEKVSSLLEGRSGAQCMHRYIKSVNPEIKKGRWTKEEDDLLRKGMAKYGSNWSKVRLMIPSRTDSQIRERWSDVLDPSLNKSPWTKEEDEKLLKILEEQGTKNWTKIASQLPGRNDNRCWRRWRTLTRSKRMLKKSMYSQTSTVSNACGRFQDKQNKIPVGGRKSNNQFTKTTSTAAARLPPPPAVTRTTTSYSAVTTITRKPSTKKSSVLPSGNEADAGRCYKRTRKRVTGTLNVKRVKSARLRPLNTASSKDNLCNDQTGNVSAKQRNMSTNQLEKAKQSKRSQSSRNRRSNKKKLTAPSPTVVSQASALPNAMPMTYLTQFSVLLQAFSIDVSGVLENVNSPKQQRSSMSQTAESNTRLEGTNRNSVSPPLLESAQSNDRSGGVNSSSLVCGTQEIQNGTRPEVTNPENVHTCVPDKTHEAEGLKVNGANANGACSPQQNQNDLEPNVIDMSDGRTNAPRDVHEDGTAGTKGTSNGIQAAHSSDKPNVANSDTITINQEPIEENEEIQRKTLNVAGVTPSSHVVQNINKSEMNCDSSEPVNNGTAKTNCENCNVVAPQQDRDHNNVKELTSNNAVICATKKVQNNGFTMANQGSDSGDRVKLADVDLKNTASEEQLGEKPVWENTDVSDVSLHQIVQDGGESDEIHRRDGGTCMANGRYISNDASLPCNSPEVKGRSEAGVTLQNSITACTDNRENRRVVVDKNIQQTDQSLGHEERDTRNSGEVVLSDSRHGLAHDIVILSDVSNKEAGQTIVVEQRDKRERLPRKRISNTSTQTAKKRQRKNCDHGANTDNLTAGDVDDTNNESSRARSRANGVVNVRRKLLADKMLRKRYPVRSTRGRRESIDNMLVGPAADAQIDMIVKGSGEDESEEGKCRDKPPKPMNTDHISRQNNEKDMQNSVVAKKSHVPLVPPLPPSATTLNAFKKLLTLRKDLQSQAKLLGTSSENQTGSQSDCVEAESTVSSSGCGNTSNATRVTNPLADRLLVDSGCNQTPVAEFRDSVPYQRLVSRFSGLFLWPGFLSIVNPSFCKKK